MHKMLSIDLEYSEVVDLEKVNPLFSRAKIYVMYHGENRNNSSISKEAVERSLHTIKNIPIVGEFKVSEDGEGNFGGHGGRMEIDDDGIRYIDTTKPIGVIPNDAEVYWTTVLDEKEREREYLVVEGAYLWNRYYDEVATLKEDNFGQSMEIQITDGSWDEERDIFTINEFIFSALCILGIDKNGEGHVEPAFEDAKIIAYSLDKDSFKEEFKTMLEELNFSMNDDGEEVENDMLEELLEKYSLTVEDLKGKEIEYKEMAEKDLEEVIKKEFIDVNTPENYTNEIEKLREDLLTAGKNITELNSTLKTKDSEIERLNNELSARDESIEILNTDLELLKEFKKNAEKEAHEKSVNDLLDKLGLTQEDISEINVSEMTLEEVEKELYVIIGKKFADKNLFTKGSGKIKLQVIDKEERKESPYGDLFQRYNK